MYGTMFKYNNPLAQKTKEEVQKMRTHYQGVRENKDLTTLGQVGGGAKIGLFSVMSVIISSVVFPV